MVYIKNCDKPNHFMGYQFLKLFDYNKEPENSEWLKVCSSFDLVKSQRTVKKQIAVKIFQEKDITDQKNDTKNSICIL